MKTENISDPTWKHIQERDRLIADLESQLAAAHKDLAEIRMLHRKMVNGIRDLGEKLIKDTVG